MTASDQATPCTTCGASNRPGAKFCGGCGGPLVSEIRCRSCGAANQPRQRFCDECGTPLGAGSTEDRPAPPASSLPGDFGDGRYEVLRFLGEGGRKRVYLARDARLGREVAVSAFKSEGADENALERARREATAMALLGDHANIVTVYDMGEEDRDLFLVSQYMSGGDLSGLVAQAEGGRLAIDEVVRIGSEVCAALAHAHASGVVHRDLKPQNIWLTPDGTAKLGDFGLALTSDSTRLTVEGAMVGTVAYMSPEQGLGRPADARSDLYSLGVVLYELLCGVPPFLGEDAAAVISQHVSAVPVAPSWHRSEVPRPLEQLILKLLEKDPAVRPAEAAEVLAALAAIHDAVGHALEPGSDQMDALDGLSTGSFIGRTTELRQLRRAVDETISGNGRVVTIVGEAGIGKTRLASELESYAALRGAQVLWGRCYDREGAPAFWPWVQAIRAYVKQREPDALRRELGSGASEVAQVVSEIRDRLGDLPEPQPADPEHVQFRLFDSITNFLLNASSGAPLAIFLEDLHFADESSLQLLQFAARELPSARVLMLATYRDEELGDEHPMRAVEASLARQRGYSQVRLHPLVKPEVKALLTDLSRQPLESTDELALLDVVFEESGGNPLFIEEILRHLVESETIYRRDGKWVSDARSVRDLGIPRGIRNVIESRLARLGPECRETLAAAAAIGQEFELQTLVAVTERPAGVLLDDLGEAIDSAILAHAPEEPNRYRFTHAATRETLYEELPRHRRIALHRAIAESLEELYEDRLESHLGELAHQFAAAGVSDKAADYAWWAGERAAGLSAHAEAADHYARALKLFDSLDDEPVRRCELLLALGDARWRAGAAEKAREANLEAAEISERHSLPDQYARAALGYAGGPGGFSARDHADEKVLDLLRSALERIPQRDSPLRVRVLARLAVELSYTPEQAETRRLSDAAVEIAERLGDTRILLLALYSREWSTMAPDRSLEASAASEEVIRLARLAGDREMEYEGHHLRINALLQLGRIRAVDREIRACERIAEDLRQPRYEWQTAVFRAMRALLQGRFEEGGRLAQSAFAIGQEVDPDAAMVVFGAQAFLTNWAAGTLADLADGGEEFARRYPRSAWPAALTWLLSEIGERERAQALLDELAIDGFRGIQRDGTWLTAMACLSMTCNYLEDSRAAATLYALLAPFAELSVPILAGAASLGSNHAFLGHLAETEGRLDTAVDHYDRALELNRGMGARLALPRLSGRLAATLLSRDASGDRARAAEAIERGLEIARELRLPKETERLLGIKLEAGGISDVDVESSIEAVARSVEQTRPDMRRAAAPDGTVTIMFSDIQDSTVLTERLGDRRWLELLGEHDAIVRTQLQLHDGYEVKSQGDGFMLAFASARSAINCAISIQRELAVFRARSPEQPLHARIGLHAGEVIRDHDDFFGKNVILAARIGGRARGGEILVSSLLRELVASSGDFEFGPNVEMELKGLSGRYGVAEVLWEGAAEAKDVAASALVGAHLEHPRVGERPEGDDQVAAELPAWLCGQPGRPYVGREREHALLDQLFSEVDAGGLRIVAIAGEPGIGKTRLAGRAAHEAKARNAIAIGGRTHPDSGSPYGPWIEAFGLMCDTATDEELAGHVERHGGELARLVPTLLQRVPRAPAPTSGGDPETERYLVLGAATDLLCVVSARAPLVVVLDDLHWADRSTVALLSHLLGAEPEPHALVIATYRPADLTDDGGLADWLAQLEGNPRGQAIELGGLAAEDVEAMVEARLGQQLTEPARRLATEIHREADGNPFFSLELLEHLLQSGRLGGDQADGLTVPDEGVRLELPANVQELVRQRVGRLGAEVVEALTAAATLGREFELGTLAPMLGVAPDELSSRLEPAVVAGILSRASSGADLTFTHGLFNQALYRDMRAERRAELHRLATDALEARDGHARPAELAHHAFAAAGVGGEERAVRYGLAAGREALSELVPDMALRWLRRSLELHDRRPGADPALRCDLLVGIGDAQRQLGDRQYHQTLLQASNLADDLGDVERLASAALANNRGWTSRVGEADAERIALLERALSLAGPDRPATRARLLAQLAIESVYAVDLDRRLALSDEALELARKTGDDVTLAYVLGRRYLAVWAPETFAQRRETVAEFDRVSERLNSPIARFGAASWRLLAALEGADIETADRALEQKAALAHRIGRPVMVWETLFQRAARAYLAGRLEESENLAQQAVEVGRDQPDAAAIFGAQLVAVRYDQGRLGEFADMFVQVVDQNPGLSTFRAALALMHCELDRFDDARRLISEAARDGFADVPRDNLWLTTLATYADAIAQLGDAEAAATVYSQLEPFADRLVVNGVNANGCVARHLASLAAVIGRPEAAERHFRRAVEIHERVGAPIFLARTRFEWARAVCDYGLPGGPSAAREQLQLAEVVAREWGCAALQRRIAAAFEQVARRAPA